MLGYGCTRVELGVQCLDDKIYEFVNRGHGVKEVVDATKMLRDNGFKIGYHMMLGLPGSSVKKDFEMFKKLFKDERFKPDQLKIYPCQVISGSGLSELYKKGKYKPYTKGQILKLVIRIMRIIPNYCRVMRVMREIPPDFLIAGTTRIDLRRDVDGGLKGEHLHSQLDKRDPPALPRVARANIQEIRFREIGFALRDLRLGKKINNRLKLKTTKYSVAGGEEYFLEIVNKDNILFGLLRLRIFEDSLTKEKKAFIREIHVYGKALPVGNKKKDAIQHKGLGKKLLKKAESIVKKNNIRELEIISGIGVREYFYKQGYKLRAPYVFKRLN